MQSQRSQLISIGILAIIFALGIGALGYAWSEYLLLWSRGVETTGRVIARGQTAKGPYHITYRYTVAESQEIFSTTRSVTRAIYDSSPDQAQIRILYVPERPGLSNISGNRYALMGDISWTTLIFGVVEGFVGTLLVLHIIDLRRAQRFASPRLR